MRYHPKKQVPAIMENCCDFLKTHGVTEEGIFRLPGDVNKVRYFVEQYDMGKATKFNPECDDIHTVASLLKSYIRELPSPVVPCKLFAPVLHHSQKLVKILFKEISVDGHNSHHMHRLVQQTLCNLKEVIKK